MKEIDSLSLLRAQKVADKPMVILLYRDTCHLCHDLMPIYGNISAGITSTLTKYQNFYIMDADKNAILTNKFTDGGVPTILLFKDNKCVEVPYPKEGYTENYLVNYFISFDIDKEFGNESFV